MASTLENDNGDLQLMAEFDFKDPVTATVVIYESDEELNASTLVEGSKNDTANDLNRTVSEIIEDIIRASGAYEKQINPEGDPSQNRHSPNDNTVCETFKQTVKVTTKTRKEAIGHVGNHVNNKNRRLSQASKLCAYENSEQPETAMSNSPVFFASKVIQSQDDLVPSKKRRRLAKDPKTSKKRTAITDIAVSMYESIETTPICESQADSNQKITRDKELSDKHSITFEPQAPNEVQPETRTERASSQSQDYYIANQCLRKLLDTVSTHMTFIMKAHADYVIIKRTSPKDVVESARKRFVETKTHFFYLSLSVVTNIILPRENDLLFVERFILGTVGIAHSRHLFVKYSDIKVLYDEMCTWVKSHTFQISIITDLSKKGPETNKPNTTSGKSNQYGFEKSAIASSNTTDCVSRSGPSGREFSISLDQNVVRHSQNTIQYPKQSMPNDYPVYLNSMNRMVAQLPTTYTNNRTNCCNSQYAMQPSNLSQANSTHATYHYPAQTHTQVPPPYHQTWYSATAHRQRHPGNHLTSSTHDQSFASEQEHVETNRSLSRDSGFQSPLDSLPTEAMSGTTRDGQVDPQVTPLITHVTSLNPSVLLMEDGVCHVCGVLTKQKCLGCYKCYYCSHQCQTADWKNHVWICK